MLVTKRSAASTGPSGEAAPPDPEGGGLGPSASLRGSKRVGGSGPSPTPHPRAAQAALVATQASFCVGAVYLKAAIAHIPHARTGADARAASALGALRQSLTGHGAGAAGGAGGGGLPPPPPATPTFHPVVFAFAREAAAGAVLVALACAVHPSVRPARAHLPALAALGGLLFLNQLGYILGVDAAGVVAAACMQPTVPVFTAGLAIAARVEAPTRRKLVGIGLAVAGALAMVAGGGSSSAAGAHPHVGGSGGSGGVGWGHAALLVSTVSTAVYYLLSKRLLATYPPLCVAGWAYLPAAVLMGLTASATAPAEAWAIPRSLAGPLAFWVAVCSVAGYAAVAWAASRLPASQVASFTCLQPFLGTALAAAFLGERLSPWDAGAVGVLAGLALVIRADGSTVGADGASLSPPPPTAVARTASGLSPSKPLAAEVVGAVGQQHQRRPGEQAVLLPASSAGGKAAGAGGGAWRGAWAWVSGGAAKPAVA